MALHHPQRIAVHVLARHEPRRVLAAAALRAFFLDAAYAQTLALSQRIKTQALVFTDFSTQIGLDRPRRFSDVAV